MIKTDDKPAKVFIPYRWTSQPPRHEIADAGAMGFLSLATDLSDVSRGRRIDITKNVGILRA